jgi:hypothetical protein
LKRRGAVLMHTLVIILSAMIAAGGVAAFASFAYHTAAESEDVARAQGAMEGAIAEAKWDMWSLTLAPGQAKDYVVDGLTVRVALTDMNSTTASAVLARATTTYNGRDWTASRTIGQNRFPKSGSLNWILNPANGHYYAVVRLVTGMPWTTAQANALNLTAPDGQAAYLATVSSQAEWDWMKAKIVPGLGGNSACLGGRQAAGGAEPAGSWTWANGEPWSYTDWKPGQPDNGGSGESILEVNGGGDTRWSDAADASHKHYIVEAGQWAPWVTDPVTGRSYLYVNKPDLTWNQAQTEAAAMTGPYGEPCYLASITSTHELNFLKNSVIPADVGNSNWDGPWVGAYQETGSVEPGEGWKWTSGEPFGYPIWASGRPNDAFGGEGFGHLMRFGLNDEDDGENVRGYLVEAGHPLNWQHNAATDRWYAVVPAPGMVSWTSAKAWAQELVAPNGETAYLGTAASVEEHTFITNLVSAAVAPNGSSLWQTSGPALRGPHLGLEQATGASEPSGGWGWVTGESMTFTAWDTGGGQPDNANGTEHTGMFWMSGGQWKWNDSPASGIQAGFVVEAGSNYPKWVQWKKADGGNDRWYRYVPKSGGCTYTQAAAESSGLVAPDGSLATLASVTSADEAAFLAASVVQGVTPGTHSSIAWIGGAQEPGSWEPKMGYQWITGESMTAWWRGFNWTSGTPEPNETTGTVSSGSYEDYVFLSNNSGTLNLNNWGPANQIGGYIAEAGPMSSLYVLQTQWKCSLDGTANPHPDSADGPIASADFTSVLGKHEWPVLSSTGKGRLTDFDSTTSEWQIWSPGDRGSNHVISDDWGGVQSLPFDANLDDSGGPITFGKQLAHAKGTFWLADTAALNAVTISLATSTKHFFVFINGNYSFARGQSLTNRSHLKVGENRIDFFSINRQGAGAMELESSVPIKPYARPLSQVHPFQYGLAVKAPGSNTGSPKVSVEGNMYVGPEGAGGFGSASAVKGFLIKESGGAFSAIAPEQTAAAQSALAFPWLEPAQYSVYANVTHATGTTVTSPTFGTGALHYSSGTLTLTGNYSGVGTVAADTVIISGHLRPKTVDSKLMIVAKNLEIQGQSGRASYVDIFARCQILKLQRDLVVTGAVACDSVQKVDGAGTTFTFRHADSLWRQKTLANSLKVPGYWTPSGLTYIEYTYTGGPGSTPRMLDLTDGEFPGGYMQGTLSGRLNSSWKPLASPRGRTWNTPTIQMQHSTAPGRNLLWWTAGSTVTEAAPVIWTSAFSRSATHKGGWWRGGFDVASAAERTSLTMALNGSDDMAVVYINGKLAIDQGGKHAYGYGSTTLTDKSLVNIGSNRIDIFWADLAWGGSVDFTSNAAFYPVPPTLPSPAAPDLAYNMGLYVKNGFSLNANFDILGDVMVGPINRNSGVHRIRGLAWSEGSWPSGITYNSTTYGGTTLLPFPSLPSSSTYQSKATETLNSGTLGSRSTGSTSVQVLYRPGDLNLSGTFTGLYVIAVTGNVYITGNIALGNSNSHVTVIAYGNLVINGGTGSLVLAGAYLSDGSFELNRTTTLTGSLWANGANFNSSFTLYQTGKHFFDPESWAKSYLPGYIP